MYHKWVSHLYKTRYFVAEKRRNLLGSFKSWVKRKTEKRELGKIPRECTYQLAFHS